MEYTLKAQPTSSKNENETVLKPYYIEIADKMFGDFMDMNHRDAAEAFKYLQQKICNTRVEQAKNMMCDLEQHAKDVEAHKEGTNQIAAAL